MDYRIYIGKVIPTELATKVWELVSKLNCAKSLTHVGNGCIIEIYD